MKNVYDQLYERGEVFHPWFGVFPYNNLDKRLGIYLGIPIRETNPDTDEPFGIVGVLIDEVAQVIACFSDVKCVADPQLECT